MQQKTQFEEFGNEAESRASGPMVVTRRDGSHQPMEGEAMLRKGIITLMISVMSVSGIQAADGGNSNSLLGLFRGPSIGRTQPRPATPKTAPGGVQHAVIEDVDRQVPEVRQTSARPEQETLQPAESAPQPTPISYSQPAPTPYSAQPLPPANLPQVSPETHPQFFSGTAAGGQAPENGNPFQFASSSHSGFGGYGQGYGTHGSVMGTPGFSHHPHHLINGAYLPGNSDADGSAGPLYPSPKPGIPHQVGGTAIVHQAFHPHEMLYAHKYKSMYGPYYYKVKGGWMLTPFGVWSKENWKLQGTTVDVKYKSHISPFARFHPPVIR